MAYFNLLAAVSEADIVRLRADPTVLLTPSLVSGASHVLAYWVEAQPLGGLLARALDGGEILRPELWHPLRPPLVHHPSAVCELAEQVHAAVAELSLADDDWLAAEVGRLLRVFRHAAETGECVVSVLDAPGDAARRNRVRQLWLVPGAPSTFCVEHRTTPGSIWGWLRSFVRRG